MNACFAEPAWIVVSLVSSALPLIKGPIKVMQAITYERYGPPEVLHIKEVAKPTPRDDEILINVRAAEVTKTDCEMRSFNFQVKWFCLPLRFALGLIRPRKQILGGYFAGEVAAVGKKVANFNRGDQV